MKVVEDCIESGLLLLDEVEGLCLDIGHLDSTFFHPPSPTLHKFHHNVARLSLVHFQMLDPEDYQVFLLNLLQTMCVDLHLKRKVECIERERQWVESGSM